jgi:hypothetical protein
MMVMATFSNDPLNLSALNIEARLVSKRLLLIKSAMTFITLVGGLSVLIFVCFANKRISYRPFPFHISRKLLKKLLSQACAVSHKLVVVGHKVLAEIFDVLNQIGVVFGSP